MDDFVARIRSKIGNLLDSFHAASFAVPTSFPKDVQGGILTPEQAVAVFDHLADMPDIAFGYRRSGCFARSRIMCDRLTEAGLTPSRAWALKGKDQLTVQTADGKNINWPYHVAPALPVRGKDGSVRLMVFDPSLFDGPVTLKEWGQVMQAPAERLKIVAYRLTPKPPKGYDVYGPITPEDAVDAYEPITPEHDLTDSETKKQMEEFLSQQQKGQRTVFGSQMRQQIAQTQEATFPIDGMPAKFPMEGKTWRSVPNPRQQASQETTMVPQPALR